MGGVAALLGVPPLRPISLSEFKMKPPHPGKKDELAKSNAETSQAPKFPRGGFHIKLGWGGTTFFSGPFFRGGGFILKVDNEMGLKSGTPRSAATPPIKTLF